MSEYCKYHPKESATYTCHHCQHGVCDSCVDEHDGEMRCFVCGNPLESEGAGRHLPPFWRRLSSCFKYPLGMGTVALILIASALASIATVIGGFTGFILAVIISGVMTKFGFLCLQTTADGDFKAPPASDAMSGGVKIIIHLILIFVGIMIMIFIIGKVMGGVAAVAATAFWLFCGPAVYINYARYEEIGAALNPAEAIRLIFALGGAYIVLCVFLMIMVGSVATINQFLDKEVYFFSATLQSIVSYYYMVVMFHLMGYLIFQKQKALGFSQRIHSDEAQRSPQAYLNAKIDVLVKEGEFEQVSQTFKAALKENPQDWNLCNRYIDYICAIRQLSLMDPLWDNYFAMLEQRGRLDQSVPLIQKLMVVDKTYQPTDIDVRLKLAKQCLDNGKAKLAVVMMKGIQKATDNPIFLLDAYRTMEQAFGEIPGKTQQVKRCQDLITELEEQFSF